MVAVNDVNKEVTAQTAAPYFEKLVPDKAALLTLDDGTAGLVELPAFKTPTRSTSRPAHD